MQTQPLPNILAATSFKASMTAFCTAADENPHPLQQYPAFLRDMHGTGHVILTQEDADTLHMWARSLDGWTEEEPQIEFTPTRWHTRTVNGAVWHSLEIGPVEYEVGIKEQGGSFLLDYTPAERDEGCTRILHDDVHSTITLEYPTLEQARACVVSLHNSLAEAAI